MRPPLSGGVERKAILAAMLLLSTPAASQTVAGSAAEPQVEQADKADVDQVLPPETIRSAKPAAGAVQQIRPSERAPTAMLQLPPDAEVAPSATSPEEALTEASPPSPRADLYHEVATVWEMIRKRGQQPTPELIAREIGPDNLARFLSDFPAAVNMFGVDSDSIPVSPPHPDK